MKIKFKNNTIEAEVVLPEKPSVFAEKILSQQTQRILADGATVDGPEFDGMEPEEEPIDEGPKTHPDILISQQLDQIGDMTDIIAMFTDKDNYSTIEIEDEETQETRTFQNIEIGGIQYIPAQFAWIPDGKGGLEAPMEFHYAEICLRGDEVE